MSSPHRAISAWLHNSDQSAACWLVDAYSPLLRGVIAHRIQDQGTIDDILQDTFIKAFRALARYKHRTSFEAWLCAIARNTMAHHHRRQQRSPLRPAHEGELENYPETHETPWLAPELPTERIIHSLLHLVTKRDRRILTLVHLQGHSPRSVAHRLGLTHGNVRIRLMRTHRALRPTAKRLRAAGQL